MLDMAPRGSFRVDQKLFVALEVVLVGSDIAWTCLVRDYRATGEAFLDQSSNAPVHIFLLHGNPGSRDAGECVPVCVNARRVYEDCEKEGSYVCAGDDEDVGESVCFVALVDGICRGEED
jgi:hypothetical protein